MYIFIYFAIYLFFNQFYIFICLYGLAEQAILYLHFQSVGCFREGSNLQ